MAPGRPKRLSLVRPLFRMLVSWNWLNELVPLKVTPAELVERLMMAGLNHESTEQLGNDYAIDLEITSNRPDCLGHIGIAREAAVLLGLELRFSEAKIPGQANASQPSADSHADEHRIAEELRDYTSVTIGCPDLCPRYTARVIRGVKIGPPPSQMAMRLAAVGQPVINNVVDITNYVMMECGQPLHAFDFQTLRGRRLIVRRAKAGEPFQAIDHKTYTLEEQMCVIADAERPVALAGVMGGADTEVTSRTTDVLIEAAQFAPLNVRSTARKLKLHSASSYRFERGTDPEMVDWASRRACELILKHAGGELINGVIDVGPPRSPRPVVRLRLAQLARIIGIAIPPETVQRILTALGCREQSATATEITTMPPSWRRDLDREVDLVEEVARVHGYDKIPEDAKVPMAASHRPKSDRILAKIREVLTAAGHDEALTASVIPARWSEAFSPWTDQPPLVVNTPMLEGADCLRRSLVPSLLDARRTNESLSNPTIELFETAKIYLSMPQGLPREPLTLAAVSGRGFAHLKGVVEGLLVALRIAEPLTAMSAKLPLLDGQHSVELQLGTERLGFLGELSAAGQKTFGLRGAASVLEIDLGQLQSRANLSTKYAPQSQYPTISRDLNLVVPEAVRWADLSRTVKTAAGDDLERLEYLDTYRDPQKDGSHRKRLHFSFTLRGSDRTLTNQEADALRDAVVIACQTQHEAKLLAT